VHEHAEAGGVDEAAIAEVDQHRADAAVDRGIERLAKLRGGRVVEFATEVERADACV
jgi:hypothetical protein